MAALKVDVRIDRKHAEASAFVVVPVTKVARWKLTATTTVEGTLDGVALGRSLVGRLELTAADGMPVCASVHPRSLGRLRDGEAPVRTGRRRANLAFPTR
jgi:hypothetical protein